MPAQKAPRGGMVAGNIFTKGGRFVARPLSRVATVMQRLRTRPAPDARQLSRLPQQGNAELQALAQKYRERHGIQGHALAPLEAWSRLHAEHMARTYDALRSDPSHPDVKAAYRALADETRKQHDFLREHGYHPEYMHDDPYPNSAAMAHDLATRKRIKVFKTGAGQGHPMLTDEENDMFRFVHDVFGHGMHGHQFGPKGEDNAYREHSSMFSPLARRAMATETRGQNSWVNAGPHSHLPVQDRPFAEQKAALWPEHLMGEYKDMGVPEPKPVARLSRPASDDLFPFEAERLGKMRTRERKELDRHVNAAVAGRPGVLPTQREVTSLAHFGDPVKGGYHDAHKLMTDLLPHPHDAERWAAINAVLSANEGWLHHTEGATHALALWHKAGRPTDHSALSALFGSTHDGKGRARFTSNNSVYGSGNASPHIPHDASLYASRKLSPPNYDAVKAKKLKHILSLGDGFRFSPHLVADGAFKTPNFAAAHFDERGVPIDTHMAKLLRLRKKDKGAKETVLDAQKRLVDKAHIALGYKTLVSHAAREMGWEPRQVQEAVWVAILSLALAKRHGADGSFGSLVEKLDRRAMRSGWDMHTVFKSDPMMQALHHLGVTDRDFDAAVKASRKRHPVVPHGMPSAPDSAAVESAAERLPSAVAKAAVPIQDALRHGPVKLSRLHDGRPSSKFDALLHLAILAAFGDEGGSKAKLARLPQGAIRTKELKLHQAVLGSAPEDKVRRSALSDHLSERGQHHDEAANQDVLMNHDGPVFVTRHPVSKKVVAVRGTPVTTLDDVDRLRYTRSALHPTRQLSPELWGRLTGHVVHGPRGIAVVTRLVDHPDHHMIATIDPNDGVIGRAGLSDGHHAENPRPLVAALRLAHRHAFGT